jgi:predicted nucleic acid-binding protein
LAFALNHADWFPSVPEVFSLAHHPDDDHVFNLAIAAKAPYLITWENRILRLQDAQSEDGIRLRTLSPGLRILRPVEFVQKLRE